MSHGAPSTHPLVTPRPPAGRSTDADVFREHASGLYVPAEISREREVWTRDEWKLIDRVAKLVTGREMKMLFGCTRPECQAAPIERIRRPDGGITLRCAHKDRDFVRKF